MVLRTMQMIVACHEQGKQVMLVPALSEPGESKCPRQELNLQPSP